MDENLLKNATVNVYNQTGVHITQLQLRGRLTPINLNFPTGIYIVVITDNNDLRKEIRVVIR